MRMMGVVKGTGCLGHIHMHYGKRCCWFRRGVLEHEIVAWNNRMKLQVLQMDLEFGFWYLSLELQKITLSFKICRMH